ncbi:hypothetical protein [Corynebacterium sp. 335C]
MSDDRIPREVGPGAVPSDSGPVRAESRAGRGSRARRGERRSRGRIAVIAVAAILVAAALAWFVFSRVGGQAEPPTAQMLHDRLGEPAKASFHEGACMENEEKLYGVLEDEGPLPAVDCVLIDGPFTGDDIGILVTLWTDRGAIDAVEDGGDGFVDLGGSDGHDLSYHEPLDVMYDVQGDAVLRYQGFKGIDEAREFAGQTGLA